MYFPYLRGKQYELLALRELVTGKLLSRHVIPIIEPIKISPTFENTLDVFAKADMQIGIVFNPTVGELCDVGTAINKLKSVITIKTVIPSVLINDNATFCLEMMRRENIPKKNTIAILKDRDCLSLYEKAFATEPPLYTMLPQDRKMRHTIKNDIVLFHDNFNKKPRNADYTDDEFFSDDHLYYLGEGYQGFGDYSIIGDAYQEASFAPFAVAIHIVYFDKDYSLRIKHFISDSNEDTSDVAGKFYEALSKLERWSNHIPVKQQTKGFKIFLKHFSNGTYPGLPTLKKLSIMHHLELMSKCLDGKVKK